MSFELLKLNCINMKTKLKIKKELYSLMDERYKDEPLYKGVSDLAAEFFWFLEKVAEAGKKEDIESETMQMCALLSNLENALGYLPEHDKHSLVYYDSDGTVYGDK